jgi:hypothetical protein
MCENSRSARRLGLGCGGFNVANSSRSQYAMLIARIFANLAAI